MRWSLLLLASLTWSLACAGLGKGDDDDDDDDRDDHFDEEEADDSGGAETGDTSGDSGDDSGDSGGGGDRDGDGDGWTDAEEDAAGTNPAYAANHPLELGDYLVGACGTVPDEASAGPTGTGVYETYEWDAYQEGDVVEDLQTEDSYGQAVPLYAFCGNYVLITESAEWCSPCQDLASNMAADAAELRATIPNFTFFEVLYQDNYGALADRGVLEDWRDAFGLDGLPVVAPLSDSVPWISHINASGGIPATLLLAPDMTVIWSAVDHPSDYYLYDVRTIRAAIRAYEESR